MAESISERVRALVEARGADSAVAELVQLAAADRAALEAERNRVARCLLGRSDDYEATAVLTLLNRALSQAGWSDPYSWKHRRKP